MHGARRVFKRVAGFSRVHGIIPPFLDLASVKNARERFTFVVQLSRGFSPLLDTDLSSSTASSSCLE